MALQEVDKGVERTARQDLGAQLAQLTGLECVFSNNYHFQGGEYGNAVLTRFPVVRRPFPSRCCTPANKGASCNWF